jgi:hypothetical protein
MWEYLVEPSIWRTEICRGLDPTRAAKALDKLGLLAARDPGRWTAAPRLGQYGTVRVYAVRGTILEAEDGK